MHGFFGYLLFNLASVTRVKENEMSNTVMITDISKVAGFSIDMCHFFSEKVMTGLTNTLRERIYVTTVMSILYLYYIWVVVSNMCYFHPYLAK